MLKWFDMPPVWLAVFLALARIQHLRLPVGPPGGPASDLVAGMLVGGGLLLMLLAVIEMRRMGTTLIPHRIPARMVETGIFRRSRNPIYLGDTLILAGVILWWGAWPSLVLVPLFMWLITDRFIREEEAFLRTAFGDRFDAYARQVRRWI